ncbi:hypothetical protein GUJ93_ZPchr0013g34103 [Zizania palustris]|uniref:Uncharacterized protein n=1 Tax=Zizania palustris TaxID=103762 RepID=A0A8J6BZ20_ZIZPA|nr:hypothetical protein GUJ93_ZPchr0013g34103 [Zizania palustris]
MFFGVKNSDLVPGKYEGEGWIHFVICNIFIIICLCKVEHTWELGGLKLWEGSLDLVKTLNSDIKDDLLLVQGKRVLELGCGHGLPSTIASLKKQADLEINFN